MTDISFNIKKFRLQKGLTLLELANKLGVSESTIHKYETKRIKNIKYDTIVQLAEVLEVTPQELMGWDKKENTIKDFTDKINRLSEEEKDDVMRYIDFVRSKR